MRKHLLFWGVALFFLSCKKEPIEEKLEPIDTFTEVLPAGDNCSVFDETELAFSYRIKGLSSDQNLHFFVGNSFFNQNWVESPSSTTARDGLGPLFNTRSCSSCHFRDGRGEPTSGKGLLIRLSTAAGFDDPTYWGQFQDFAVSGAAAEGKVDILYTEIGGSYPDGTPYFLRKPVYNLINLNYGPLASDLQTSPRVGSQMIGLGLLELIPDATLLAWADENDANGDGISGRPNYVNDAFAGTVIGRLGWKANTGTMEAQVAGAFNGDIGIRTPLKPGDNHTTNQSMLDTFPNGGSPEITQEDFDKVVLYCRTLGVPVRRNQSNTDVRAGEKLFKELNCVACHKEVTTTGNSGNISALKAVKIRPYTDLLLHDMGPDLADDRPDGDATGNEWRTTPLWGLGLIKTVNGHTYLLHDGRARSIEEAILWHGGEAEAIRNKFMLLSAADRQKVLLFLESL